jgi:hypothetical protein
MCVGVATLNYTVVLPFRHPQNTLETVFRTHWRKVCVCVCVCVCVLALSANGVVR